MEKNELLAEYLEKIIFNELDLKILKNNIEDLQIIGKEKKELIKLFISHLAIVYEKLNDKLPFYLESYLIKFNFNNSSEKKTDYSDLDKMKAELNEKNKFLIEVGIRINDIYKKLL